MGCFRRCGGEGAVQGVEQAVKHAREVGLSALLLDMTFSILQLTTPALTRYLLRSRLGRPDCFQQALAAVMLDAVGVLAVFAGEMGEEVECGGDGGVEVVDTFFEGYCGGGVLTAAAVGLCAVVVGMRVCSSWGVFGGGRMVLNLRLLTKNAAVAVGRASTAAAATACWWWCR